MAENKKKTRVTLEQVAKHAGVSTTTASLIMRKSKTISSATRDKVLASMDELGYVYDRVAANLRSKSSTTIGLIITEIANPYFSELVNGVNQKLDAQGYTVLLGATSGSLNKQNLLLSTMLEYRVGGVILCPVADSSIEIVKRFEQWDIPLILVTNDMAGVNRDYVSVDYIAGARQAVEHLLRQGHRRIAFLGGPTASSSWQARKQGYVNALNQAGIEIDESLISGSPMSREGGLEALGKVLLNPDPPTAIFCFSDVIAFGVMVGLKEAGLAPGKDIAVVGFDNVKEAATSSPSLSTVSSSPQLVGNYAADLLYQRIMGLEEDPKRIVIQPELIIRNSSKQE